MEIKLVIPGPPMGKQVAKVFPIRGKGGKVLFRRGVTPAKTANAMAVIRLTFAAAYPNFTPITGPVELTLRAFFPIPKSTPRRMLPAMEAETVFYAHRPDWTNLAKLAEDSLTGAAWKDDALVVKIGGESGKWYSTRPRLEIIIRTLD